MELISAFHCVGEVDFLSKLVEEIGFHQVSHIDLRHIDLRYMFLSDYITRGLVKFERVDSKNQIVDIGTTPRPWSVFQRRRPVLYGES